MNLVWVRIKNFRSCKDVEINLGGMHAIVGANNAGKSNILRALDFLFNPSTTAIDDDFFWNRDTTERVWIEARFVNLTPSEREELKSWLRRDNSFHMARSVELEDDGYGEAKPKIGQHGRIQVPPVEWLNPSEITPDKIKEWWGRPGELKFGDHDFVEFIGQTKAPAAKVWKEKAKEFVTSYVKEDDLVDTWDKNPKGYSGVLKKVLPHFIYVPTVKDVSDEAKVLKTNPFGQLLQSVFRGITIDQKEQIDTPLNEIDSLLNRTGGNRRFPKITEFENRLNYLLKDFMKADLEIEFQLPTLEDLIETPRVLAFDGSRNIIQNKGHGLQRAVIFSIIRYYAELKSAPQSDDRRASIFAVEEPELYMHPQAQRTIKRAFRKIVQGGDQVLYSTHSSLLVDVEYFDEIIRVTTDPVTTGSGSSVESSVWQLAVQQLVDDLKVRHPNTEPTRKSIRDRYAHAYHPNRSEGFFADRIILVEGATEQYALPIYAPAADKPFDELNIAVVDCGGKDSIDRLYRIFNEFHIPCYLLFDYDKNSDKPATKRKSKELLELVGAASEPPEQTLILDNVACFPDKWEIDLKEEIDEYDELVTKARKEYGLEGDSGKPLIARYMAKQLVSTNPPTVPVSLSDIIAHAARVEWVGSCLKTIDDA